MKAAFAMLVGLALMGCDRKATTADRVAATNAAATIAPNKNAEWEKKCRAKLTEAIALLKANKQTEASADGLDKARECLEYAFYDRPGINDLTTDQSAMMMEMCIRLEAIAFKEGEPTKRNRFQQQAIEYRKNLGWDIDKFKDWRLPIFQETIAWIK